MPNVDFLFIDQPFVVALCAVVVSGVLRGYSGFGAALIIIPIFSNLYSPLTALSFHVLVEMPTLLVLLPTAVKTYDKKLVNFSLLSLVLAVTYSPLSLYFIIDNKLITEKLKINDLFDNIIKETSLESRKALCLWALRVRVKPY